MRGVGNTEILPEKSTNVCCIFIEQLEIETAAVLMVGGCAVFCHVGGKMWSFWTALIFLHCQGIILFR